MPRVSVTTQQITRAGLTPVVTAPGLSPNGDVFDAGGTALYVVNGATPSTVTIQATASQDGLNVEDLVVVVPASTTKLIGPFPPRTFGQPVGGADAGRVYADYSSVATVQRAVVAF